MTFTDVPVHLPPRARVPARARYGDSGSWFPGGVGQAQMRLFCFGYAGGGASIFHNWSGWLDSGIDVVPVQPPGREGRVNETVYRHLGPLLDELVVAIRGHLDRPFAFYGHSMGALVAFELTRRLRADGAPLPRHLFAAAFRAPQLPNPNLRIFQMPDDVLKAVLSKEGTPQEVLRDAALMSHILPTLRGDFEVCETYEHTTQAPLPVSITAFGGSQDVRVRPDLLPGWAEHTAGEFDLVILPGSHFFLHSAREQLLNEICTRLEPHTVQGEQAC